jgi:hypothetical protein
MGKNTTAAFLAADGHPAWGDFIMKYFKLTQSKNFGICFHIQGDQKFLCT